MSDTELMVEGCRAADWKFFQTLLMRFAAPPPDVDVAEWARRAVKFNEPKVQGFFSLYTRNYLRAPLNLWRQNHEITDVIVCMSTRSGKTRIPMVGAAYRIRFDAMRCLWTKPMKQGPGGAHNDAKTKFIPMLKCSPGTAEFIPTGAAADELTTLQQIINGSIVDWAGTGSPKQLAGNPDDVVVQDEVDGYVQRGETHAHPSIEADERTKDAARPFRYKGGTPTLATNVIWSWLMKSDLRRRFLPCPFCTEKAMDATARADFDRCKKQFFAATGGETIPLALVRELLIDRKYFVCGWSEQFNVLPLKLPDGTEIPMGYMTFRTDATGKNDAKGRDGVWDIERAMSNAHLKCPHCGGAMLDEHKIWMDEHGEWAQTQRGTPGVAGFQLSSLYVFHPETAYGRMVKKFLGADSKKGFINNDLAEVDDAQEHGRNEVVLASENLAQTEWIALATADFQKLWPFIWFVVRKWSAFKLQPPFAIFDGKPDFLEYFSDPANARIKAACEKLHGGEEASWIPIAELLRLDPRTGDYPALDWMIGKGITGKTLVQLFREKCGSNGLDLGRFIYREMGRRFPRGGDSELVACGHCGLSGEHAWTEFAEILKSHEVGRGLLNPNRAVGVDCGYAERHNPEVLRKCYESASVYKWYDPLSRANPPIFHASAVHGFCQVCPADNWLPLKGYPITKRWTNLGVSNETHVGIQDPYMGGPDAGQRVIEVLEMASGLFWLRKEDFRRQRGGYIYSVAKDVEMYPKVHALDGTVQRESTFKLEEYQRQLNEQYYDERGGKIMPKHGKSGTAARRHPYHLDDCETYQIGLAHHHSFFEYEAHGGAGN